MSGFRSSVWDPVLIISQIISLQCLFWTTLGCWVYAVDFIGGGYISLGHLFDYTDFIFKESQGKLLLSAFLLNSLTGSLGLWSIVKRTKQCWDFAITTHLFHLIVCCIYSGFPRTAVWWLVNLLSVIFMTVLGEFLCMRTELQAIPLSMGPKVNL